MKNSGYTLLETVVVVGIFSFVSIVIMNFVLQTYNTGRFVDQQNSAVVQAKRAGENMVKEIREIAGGEDGAYPIQQASPKSFTFFADMDLDNVVEKITYMQNGNMLEKGVTEPTGQPLAYLSSNTATTTISQYLRNTSTEPIFTYYDASWDGATSTSPLTTPADPDEVKLIHIFLRVNYNPFRSPNDFIFEGNAQPRSLKENL